MIPFVRIAHRGASMDFPENTLLAFHRALEAGVDGLELDVHLTRDGKLVVIHDAALDRTTSGTGLVRDHLLEEIRGLDAGLGERVPVLDEVVALTASAGTLLCVEVKGADPAEELRVTRSVVRAVQESQVSRRVIVTSFSPDALQLVRRLAPDMPTMLDPSPQDGTLAPEEICEQTLRAGANCLSFDHQFVTAELAAAARRAGLALYPWGANTPDEIRSMLQVGLTGLMTDCPQVLNQVLHEFTF